MLKHRDLASFSKQLSLWCFSFSPLWIFSIVNTVLFHLKPGPGYRRGNWVSIPALGILHSWPRKGVAEYTGLTSLGPNCGKPRHFSASLQRAWLSSWNHPTPIPSPRQNFTQSFPLLASNVSWDSLWLYMVWVNTPSFWKRKHHLVSTSVVTIVQHKDLRSPDVQLNGNVS